MAGATSLPVDRELRRLLRTGTFAEALDHALNVRGLSLERVQHHLAERDVRVSRAALSYWRHGRSRPERAESLRAVRALEEVLDLPAETLVSMLGPPRPRGRAATLPGAMDRRRLWPSHSPLLTAMDAPPDGQLSFLDVHEHVLVDEHRQLAAVRTRLVVEANADRIDRCVVYLWTEEPSKPRLTGLRYCRLGRMRSNDELGAVVTELMLDQRLSTGERSVLEYEWNFPPGPELTFFHRRFTRPSRQFVLQVEFAGEVPATCVPYRQLTMEAPRQLDRPLWIGASETAHLVVTDLRPGIVGLTWEWD
ncbi:XRE family transcriptional regulator [Kribbella monticola]|uniref:XRE family transcriptional regulator n=1 Tax=Kribbella monticola TaxID=2185285 RepID=UPI000DD3C6A5|nr:XRE family transcriptional regulator [Kribbella monticola]